jgi:xylulose-5-phosphate/fructose-6-phosphate phosphoketolase
MAGVQLDIGEARRKWDAELRLTEKVRRAANYLSAAQLYLKDNVLLEQDLKLDHIKDRLLGHWGALLAQLCLILIGANGNG